MRLKTLLGILTFVSAAHSAPNILISGGAPYAGFGDVASNVLMAQLLRRHLPEDASVTLVLESKGAREIYDQMTKQTGPPEGLNVIVDPYDLGEQRFELGLVFSHIIDLSRGRNDPIPEALRNHADHTIAFEEYGGATSVSDDRQVLGENGFYFPSWDESKNIRLKTGPLAGMYLDPTAPRPAPKTPGNQEAFAYTAYPLASVLYFRTVVLKAKATPSEKWTLRIRNFPEILALIAQGVPNNLQVETFQALPHSEFESKIRSSTFPAMVTGDVSMTLCVQHDIPFFYEALPHKRALARTLTLALSFSQWWDMGRLVLPSQWATQIYNEKEAANLSYPFRNGIVNNALTPEALIDLASNQKWNSTFHQTMREMRKNSLVSFVQSVVASGITNHDVFQSGDMSCKLALEAS